MVEVFKTNVTQRKQAGQLLSLLHNSFNEFRANFDLQDVDHILRIASPGYVDAGKVIALLNKAGVIATVLEDVPAMTTPRSLKDIEDVQLKKAI